MKDLGCAGTIIVIFFIFPLAVAIACLWLGVLISILSATWAMMLCEGILMWINYNQTGKTWINDVPGDAILYTAVPLVFWAELPEKLYELYKM